MDQAGRLTAAGPVNERGRRAVGRPVEKKSQDRPLYSGGRRKERAHRAKLATGTLADCAAAESAVGVASLRPMGEARTDEMAREREARERATCMLPVAGWTTKTMVGVRRQGRSDEGLLASRAGEDERRQGTISLSCLPLCLLGDPCWPLGWSARGLVVERPAQRSTRRRTGCPRAGQRAR